MLDSVYIFFFYMYNVTTEVGSAGHQRYINGVLMDLLKRETTMLISSKVSWHVDFNIIVFIFLL